MKQTLATASSEVQLLNQKLLSGLDETFFFGELVKHLQSERSSDLRIQVYRVLDDASTQMLIENGQSVIDALILPKGEGISGYIVRSKRAYFSNDIKRDPLFANAKVASDVIAELAVPVNCGGQVMATIHVQSQAVGHQFNQSDVNSIIEILNQVSVPLQNMKLYLAAKNLSEALQKKIDAKEREIHERRTGIAARDIAKIKDVHILGNSAPMHEVARIISKVAGTDSSLMIVGGPGTGKELFAKKIHSLSARKDGPFIVVNCGAYQESALESEIFGLEKGTLPNAPHARTGVLEKADGGTILLDEVDQLGPVMQARLFRFLQEGEGVRMGGSVPYKANVRMIACTNKDISDCVAKGKFREDLYYRINTLTITVPSLRDRKGDIPTLANHFLNSEYPVESHKILTPSAIKVLEQHCWPGNVRELKNVVERARILCDGKFIDEHCLPTSFQVPTEDQEAKSEIFREMTIDSLEKKHILDTLNHLGGNKTKTAKALGITVKTLYNKLHSYGLIQAREVEVE